MPSLIRNPWKRLAVAAFDLPGRLLRSPRPLPEAPRHIVVLRLDHLGDLMLATPAFRALRKTYPRARITAVVKPWSAPVLAHNPRVDRVLVFDAPWSRTALRGDVTGALDADGLRRALRDEPADLAIDLQGDLRNIRLLAGTGAGCVVAPDWRGGIGGIDIVARPDPRAHAVRQNLAVLAAIGIRDDGPGLEFHPSAADEAHAERFFAGDLPGDGPVVAVHPGAAHPGKRWPSERFASVCRRLLGSGQRVLVLSGPGEERLQADLLERAGRPAGMVSAPSMDLGATAACLRRCRAFLGNDTGASHLAQAVSCPSVVVFGPTDPDRFGPLDNRLHRVVRPADPRAPCWWPETGNTLPGVDFMALVPEEEVWRALAVRP